MVPYDGMQTVVYLDVTRAVVACPIIDLFLNEGDCDSDNDCSGNLRCGFNNCVGSQFHPEADCCHDNSF